MNISINRIYLLIAVISLITFIVLLVLEQNRRIHLDDIYIYGFLGVFLAFFSAILGEVIFTNPRNNETDQNKD